MIGEYDILARSFVFKLASKLSIPVLVFTDASPSGLEMYTIYRFGTYSTIDETTNINIISAKRIGISAIDIDNFHFMAQLATPYQLIDLDLMDTLLSLESTNTDHELFKDFNSLHLFGKIVTIKSLIESDETLVMKRYLPLKIQKYIDL